MNREIKFKAYIEVKNEQKFYDDEKVKLIDKKLLDVIELWWQENGEVDYIFTRQGTIFANCCDIKLLQYTGLKDKNNKEVYEGDIAYLHDEKCIISWHLGGWILNRVNKSHYDHLLSGYLAKRRNGQYYSHGIEVVGNIYENKELLEDGNVRN